MTFLLGGAMAKETDKELLKLFRETEKLGLQDIRLVEADCKLAKLKEGELPSVASQTISLSVQANPEHTAIATLADFKLVFTYGEPAAGDPPLLIRAQFRMQYGLQQPLPRTRIAEVAYRL